MRHLAYTAWAACVCASIAGAQPAARKEPVPYAGPARASRIQARPPGIRLALGRPRGFAFGPLSPAQRARLAQRSSPLAIGVNRSLPAEALNAAFKAASEGELKGILGVDSNLLVSSDYKGNPLSSIVDLPLTKVVGNSVKVLSWYDNEWGYSSRVVDLIGFLAKKGLYKQGTGSRD